MRPHCTPSASMQHDQSLNSAAVQKGRADDSVCVCEMRPWMRTDGFAHAGTAAGREFARTQRLEAGCDNRGEGGECEERGQQMATTMVE